MLIGQKTFPLSIPTPLLLNAYTLLSLKDAQDVPRVIKLNLTADLRNIDSSEFDSSEQKTHSAIPLLEEMLEALVNPFINPDLNFTANYKPLIKFAYILCALFLKHKSTFIPHHLYNDLQCMVRTAVFRVAHTKVLDLLCRVFFYAFLVMMCSCWKFYLAASGLIGGRSGPNFNVDEFRNRCMHQHCDWMASFKPTPHLGALCRPSEAQAEPR